MTANAKLDRKDHNLRLAGTPPWPGHKAPGSTTSPWSGPGALTRELAELRMACADQAEMLVCLRDRYSTLSKEFSEFSRKINRDTITAEDTVRLIDHMLMARAGQNLCAEVSNERARNIATALMGLKVGTV